MTSIANNYTNIVKIIKDACHDSQRPIDQVQLLAVSKTRGAEQLAELYHLGQRHFGENYLQEAIDKQQQLADLPIIWHFIGPIQSNKTRAIAENFSWVHSVDRLKIAQRLSQQRPDHFPPLNICLQVNISDEPSKAGCSPAQCITLLQQIIALPNIKVQGLMTIPKETKVAGEQLSAFSAMADLLQQCQTVAPHLKTLSMGMSADIVPAIAQGATIVRVGTALFGPRIYNTH